MIFSLIIVILSFYLDSISSNLLCFSNLFYPLFSLLSLVIVYRYYKKRYLKKYYITSLILGLFYDLVYTNTLFLNTIIFFLLAILIHLLYDLLTNNFYNTILISLFLIICYRLFTYLILLFTGYITLHIEVFFASIYCSILVNLIYLVLFYLGTKIISKKLHIYIRK